MTHWSRSLGRAGMKGEWRGLPGGVGFQSELAGEVEEELQVELELELELLVAAPVGVSKVVHKSCIRPVRISLVRKSLNKTFMTAVSVL